MGIRIIANTIQYFRRNEHFIAVNQRTNTIINKINRPPECQRQDPTKGLLLSQRRPGFPIPSPNPPFIQTAHFHSKHLVLVSRPSTCFCIRASYVTCPSTSQPQNGPQVPPGLLARLARRLESQLRIIPLEANEINLGARARVAIRDLDM